MQPLMPHAFDRELYARRVRRCLLAMSVDLAILCIFDSIHWQTSFDGSLSGDGMFDMLIPQLGGLIGYGVVRLVPLLTLYFMVVQTRAYELGLLEMLFADFRFIFTFHTCCTVIGLIVGLLRFMSVLLELEDELWSFWGHEGFLGSLYTVVYPLYIGTTAAYYVATIYILRKLAHTEYYVHPDRSTRRAA